MYYGALARKDATLRGPAGHVTLFSKCECSVFVAFFYMHTVVFFDICQIPYTVVKSSLLLSTRA